MQASYVRALYRAWHESVKKSGSKPMDSSKYKQLQQIWDRLDEQLKKEREEAAKANK